MPQIYGNGLAGNGAIQAQISTTLVGASVTAARNQEITHATETWAIAGMYGYCIGPLNGAPANDVRPGQWRCASSGTVLLTWSNPTAGNLTPASATLANPYVFICHQY